MRAAKPCDELKWLKRKARKNQAVSCNWLAETGFITRRDWAAITRPRSVRDWVPGPVRSWEVENKIYSWIPSVLITRVDGREWVIRPEQRNFTAVLQALKWRVCPVHYQYYYPPLQVSSRWCGYRCLPSSFIKHPRAIGFLYLQSLLHIRATENWHPRPQDKQFSRPKTNFSRSVQEK